MIILLVLFSISGLLYGVLNNNVVSADGVIKDSVTIDGNVWNRLTLTQDIGTIRMDRLLNDWIFQNNAAGGDQQLMVIDTTTNWLNPLGEVEVINQRGEGDFTAVLLGRADIGTSVHVSDHAQMLFCARYNYNMADVLSRFNGGHYGSLRNVPGLMRLESGEYVRLPPDSWGGFNFVMSRREVVGEAFVIDGALPNFSDYPYDPITAQPAAAPLALSQEPETVESVDVGIFEQEGYLFIHNNIDDLEEEVAENQIDVEGAISLVIDGLEETESVGTEEEEGLNVDNDKKNKVIGNVDEASNPELEEGESIGRSEELQSTLEEKEGLVGAQELFGEEALVGSGQANNADVGFSQEVEVSDGDVRQEAKGEEDVERSAQDSTATSAEEVLAKEEFGIRQASTSNEEASLAEGFVTSDRAELEDKDSAGDEDAVAELLNEEPYLDDIESVLT